jgi:hypothetical protein
MPASRDIVASLDRHTVTNATVAWLYAITGPLAILLAVGSKVGFTHDQVAAWIFGGYAIGGFLSILMSWMCPASVFSTSARRFGDSFLVRRQVGSWSGRRCEQHVRQDSIATAFAANPKPSACGKT